MTTTMATRRTVALSPGKIAATIVWGFAVYTTARALQHMGLNGYALAGAALGLQCVFTAIESSIVNPPGGLFRQTAVAMRVHRNRE